MFEDGGRSTILLSSGTALSQEQCGECTRLRNGKECPFVIIILLVSSLLGGMKGLTDESMGEIIFVEKVHVKYFEKST